MLQFHINENACTNAADITRIAHAAGVGELAASVLMRRGIDTPQKAREFMHANTLHDPFLLRGMKEAVAMIRKAMEEKQVIHVYGDYDCDGVSACAILAPLFEQAGMDVRVRVPSRHTEGYGLNRNAVEELAKVGGLLITVDCGITNLEEVERANELGLSIIVTDHHQPLDTLPNCTVIDPWLSPEYPFQALCGAGVAFKLAHAVFGLEKAMEMIDIATIATVADIVPLLGENRTIVRMGLEKINTQPQKPGIRALMEAAKVDQKELTSGHIAFALAPRLNAAGRMGDAKRAYTLLASREVQQARALADELEAENMLRKSLEQELIGQACEQLDQRIAECRTAVAAGRGWHHGVAGIVASRLVELYGRPSAVICMNKNGVCTGSARGIPGVNVFEALCSCADILLRHGGHEQAGGFALREENLPAFLERYEAFYARNYPARTWIKTVECDLSIQPGELNLSLAKDLNALAPFGCGNPVPTVLMQDVRVMTRQQLGRTGDHLRFDFERMNGGRCEAILFRSNGRDVPQVGSLCDVVGTVELSEWNGNQRARCILKDYRLSTVDAVSTVRLQAERFAFRYAQQALCKTRDVEAVSMETIFERLEENVFGNAVLLYTPAHAQRFLQAAMERGTLDFVDFHFEVVSASKHVRNALIFAPHGIGEAERFAHIYTLDDIDAQKEYCHSLYLDKPAMRDVYKALLQYGPRPTRLRTLCKNIAGHVGCRSEQVAAAITVFLELRFFESQNFTLYPVRQTGKRDLEESLIYRRLCRP